MTEHDYIWLAPQCDDFDPEGRLWCQDNVWDDDCECKGEKHNPVRYIREDSPEIRRLQEVDRAARMVSLDPQSHSQFCNWVTHEDDRDNPGMAEYVKCDCGMDALRAALEAKDAR